MSSTIKMKSSNVLTEPPSKTSQVVSRESTAHSFHLNYYTLGPHLRNQKVKQIQDFD